MIVPFWPLAITKTLKGLKAILENIFFSALPSLCYKRLTSSGGDGKTPLSIIRIPQEINILPDLWAQLVEPGWRIKIQFKGELSDVKDAPKKEAEKPDSDSDTAKGDDVLQDISYVAYIYQQDGTNWPDFLGKETFKEPIAKQIQTKSGNTRGVLCEVRNVYRSRTKKLLGKEEDSYALIDTDDLIGDYVLEIHSSPLLHALNAVLQFHTPDEQKDDYGFRVTAENSTSLQAGRFQFPYVDLYHNIDELVAYKSKVDGSRQNHSEEYNKECDRHIDILVKYLNNQPAVEFSKAKVAWSQKIPVTTFNWLWLLFRPGSDVYVRERGCFNAYVIEYVSNISRDSTSRPRPYQVKVWNLDYDGKAFGRSSRIVSVPVFDGEREIQSLPIFPVCFHRDKEGNMPLRDVLIERGKKFVKVIKQPTYQEYTGPSSFSIARTVCSFHQLWA